MPGLGSNPLLHLDFTKRPHAMFGLAGNIPFSGGANGTRYNAQGLIEAATTPRLDYDPATAVANYWLNSDNPLLANQHVSGTGSAPVVVSGFPARARFALNGGTTVNDRSGYSASKPANISAYSRLFSVTLQSATDATYLVQIRVGGVTSLCSVTPRAQLFTVSAPGDNDDTCWIVLRGAQGTSDSCDIFIKEPLIEVTTRTTPGRYVASTGVLGTLAPEVRGLLLEEARTNLLLSSEDLTTNWTHSLATVTANVITAPDGTVTGDKLVEDTTATALHLTKQIVTSTSLYFAGSAWINNGGRRYAALQIRADDGADGGSVVLDTQTGLLSSPINDGTGVVDGVEVEACLFGWFRVGIAAHVGVAPATWAVRLHLTNNASSVAAYTGDGVSGIHFWGMQGEATQAASFGPTSYIKTVGATVARTADSAPAALDQWADVTEGTVVVDFIARARGTQQALWAINDASANNRIDARLITTGIQSIYTSGGVAQQALSVGPNARDGTKHSVGACWSQKINYTAACIDSSASATNGGYATAPVGVTQLLLGAVDAGAVPLNGWLRRLTYHRLALSLPSIKEMLKQRI